MLLALTGAGISVASGIPSLEGRDEVRDMLSCSYRDEKPEEFRALIREFQRECEEAEPNAAHIALAKYNVPVITLNFDGLHEKAGSKYVLAVNGRLPAIMLNGDKPGLTHLRALKLACKLGRRDMLLVVGVSFHAKVAELVVKSAHEAGAGIVIINEDAEHRVETFLEHYKRYIEPPEKFWVGV